MEFRMADLQDLPALKTTYEKIVEHLIQCNINIWNEAYPCGFFEDDILRDRLFVLMEGETLISAFALCAPSEYEGTVRWDAPEAKALYLFRFAVNLDCLHKGLGKETLALAEAAAKERGADYLRLFVVDYNTPAIRLYEACGYRKADGVFDNDIGREAILYEYGYEKKL